MNDAAQGDTAASSPQEGWNRHTGWNAPTNEAPPWIHDLSRSIRQQGYVEGYAEGHAEALRVNRVNEAAGLDPRAMAANGDPTNLSVSYEIRLNGQTLEGPSRALSDSILGISRQTYEAGRASMQPPDVGPMFSVEAQSLYERVQQLTEARARLSNREYISELAALGADASRVTGQERLVQALREMPQHEAAPPRERTREDAALDLRTEVRQLLAGLSDAQTFLSRLDDLGDYARAALALPRDRDVRGGGTEADDGAATLHEPDTALSRARATWGPFTVATDILVIGPLGRRNDNLIYHKTRREVITGWQGAHACFRGSLGEFEARMEEEYGGSLAAGSGNDIQQRLSQLRAGYRAAIVMLRAMAVTSA